MARTRKSEIAPERDRLRLHVAIDATLRRRLGAYASFHGLTEGQIVEDALAGRLRGFYVGQREPGATVQIPPAEEEARVLAIRTA